MVIPNLDSPSPYAMCIAIFVSHFSDGGDYLLETREQFVDSNICIFVSMHVV